ncbi:MAG: hypothetical protein H6713_28790 [Myxococcales bacterium]|nr:hypothetical protein [Myxococcales bacterium]MCB9753960.1 hypothetical protein [Myxococcales bacterium]
MIRLRAALLLALTLGLVGCGGVESMVTEINEACVTSDGDAVVVVARFADCLSSSCDTLESARCELALEDGIITVTGEAVIRSKQFGACTSDCGLVEATCTLELPPGDYTLAGVGEADMVISHPVPEGSEQCEAFGP